MTTVEVVVPAGMAPGMMISVQTPQGVMVVPIPKGAGPGKKFQFQLPAAPVIAIPVATAGQTAGAQPPDPSKGRSLKYWIKILSWTSLVPTLLELILWGFGVAYAAYAAVALSSTYYAPLGPIAVVLAILGTLSCLAGLWAVQLELSAVSELDRTPTTCCGLECWSVCSGSSLPNRGACCGCGGWQGKLRSGEVLPSPLTPSLDIAHGVGSASLQPCELPPSFSSQPDIVPCPARAQPP